MLSSQIAERATEFRCMDCDDDFESETALHMHDHANITLCYTCKLCRSAFETSSDLAAHLVSVDWHMKLIAEKPITCPLPKCWRRFGSASALLQHMESGACKSGMDRSKLNALVHRVDTTRMITDTATASSFMSDVDETSEYAAASEPRHADVEMSATALALPPDYKLTSTTKQSTDETLQPAVGSRVRNQVFRTDSVLDWTTFTMTPENTSFLANTTLTKLFDPQLTVFGAHSSPDDDEDGGVPLPPSTAVSRRPSLALSEDGGVALPSSTAVSRRVSLACCSRDHSSSMTGNAVHQSPQTGMVDNKQTNDATSETLRCSLCPPSRPEFDSAGALRMHLASTAHASKIYHSPTTELDTDGVPKRQQRFATLGSLFQHLEASARAGGGHLVKKAVEFVEGLLRAGGALTESKLSGGEKWEKTLVFSN